MEKSDLENFYETYNVELKGIPMSRISRLVPSYMKNPNRQIILTKIYKLKQSYEKEKLRNRKDGEMIPITPPEPMQTMRTIPTIQTIRPIRPITPPESIRTIRPIPTMQTIQSQSIQPTRTRNEVSTDMNYRKIKEETETIYTLHTMPSNPKYPYESPFDTDDAFEYKGKMITLNNMNPEHLKLLNGHKVSTRNEFIEAMQTACTRTPPTNQHNQDTEAQKRRYEQKIREHAEVIKKQEQYIREQRDRYREQQEREDEEEEIRRQREKDSQDELKQQIRANVELKKRLAKEKETREKIEQQRAEEYKERLRAEALASMPTEHGETDTNSLLDEHDQRELTEMKYNIKAVVKEYNRRVALISKYSKNSSTDNSKVHIGFTTNGLRQQIRYLYKGFFATGKHHSPTKYTMEELFKSSDQYIQNPKYND